MLCKTGRSGWWGGGGGWKVCQKEWARRARLVNGRGAEARKVVVPPPQICVESGNADIHWFPYVINIYTIIWFALAELRELMGYTRNAVEWVVQIWAGPM